MALLMESKIHKLDPGFTSEVDALAESAWYQVLEQFDDANIYQTWAYDEVRCGRKNISHLALRKGDEIVAVAQSRIVKLPLIRAGIAYVRWGPVWRRHNGPGDLQIFRQAIRALRNEYACRRGLVLRLYPAVFHDASATFSSALIEEGFSRCNDRPERTLLLDLRRPLEELRKGLRPHWRRYLKVAEKNGLEIIEGSNDELFRSFITIYREMICRKRFLEPNSIEAFRSIQDRLPEKFKLKIMLCRLGGKECAGLVCSAIGNTGVYLFGATSNSGLKSRGAYLLHWKLIAWLKDQGIAAYDLNGINPVTNPGTFKFKHDLCGNNGTDVHFLGRFDAYVSAASYSCVGARDSLRAIYQAARGQATALTRRSSRSAPALDIAVASERVRPPAPVGCPPGNDF